MSVWKKQYEDALAASRSPSASPSRTPRSTWRNHIAAVASPASAKPPPSPSTAARSVSLMDHDDDEEEDSTMILSVDSSTRPTPSIDDDQLYGALSASTGYSADSVIRRVEEEIAAAKAAAGDRSPPSLLDEEPSVDMDEILSPESAEKQVRRTTSSMGDQSFRSAMDMIGEEFEDELAQQDGGKKSASQEWEDLPEQPEGARARALLDSIKERRENFSLTFRTPTPREGTTSHDNRKEQPISSDSISGDEKKEEDFERARTLSPVATADAVRDPPAPAVEPVPAETVANSPPQSPVRQQTLSIDTSPPIVEKEVVTEPTVAPAPLPNPVQDKPLSIDTPTTTVLENEVRFSPRVAMMDDHTPKAGAQARHQQRAEELARKARKNQVQEVLNSRKSRRIRFRDPFPILKPTHKPRDPAVIIAENTIGPRDCPIKWIRPTNDLRQLIVAVMGASLQRRSNACGALKVLTRHKKNQMSLVRTDSFMEALVFAASQDIPKKEKELAGDARTRAVACLRNVCEPKENRLFVINHPGFLEALVKVIRNDRGEARVLACGATALLAKSPECREMMASAEGLVDLLAEVMSGMVDDGLEDSGPKLNRTLISEMSTSVTMTSEKTKDKHDAEHEDVEEDEDESTKGSFSTHGSDDESDDSSASSVYSSSSEESDEETAASYTSGLKVGLIQLNSIRQQHEEMQGEFLHRARSNACAALLHLSKHCSVSHQLCTSAMLMENLLSVAKEYDNPIHSKCLEMICNLTRFQANCSFMTRYDKLVDCLVDASSSMVAEDRVAALRGLQNLAADQSSKTLLATESVLGAISIRALQKEPNEKEAAVAFLYNVSTEPGAVVSITNTKNVVATLVHLAHHPESSPVVRLMACDALATISLWLQTLAGTGKVPRDTDNVPLPTQKTTGWERWD